MRKAKPSQLHVIDPPSEAIVTVDNDELSKALVAVRRLSVARELAIAGFESLSRHMSVPARYDGFAGLYTAGERMRVSAPLPDRLSQAVESLSSIQRPVLEDDSGVFVGREISVDVMSDSFRHSTGCNRIVVRQGVNRKLIERIKSTKPTQLEELDDEISLLQSDEVLNIKAEPQVVRLRDRNIFLAEMRFLE